MAATAYAHIDIREGVPFVAGTRIRLVDLVMEMLEGRLTAPQLQRRHHDLTLGQIHGALAYYYDHEHDIACAIAEEERAAEEVMAGRRDSPLTTKLKALGIIS